MFDELRDPTPRQPTPADLAATIEQGERIRRRRHVLQGVATTLAVVALAIGLKAVASRSNTTVRIAVSAGPPTGAPPGGPTTGPAPNPRPTTVPAVPATPPANAPASITTLGPPTTPGPTVPKPPGPITAGPVHLTRADTGRTITVAVGTTIDIYLSADPTPRGFASANDARVVKLLSESNTADGGAMTVLQAVAPGQTPIEGLFGGEACTVYPCSTLAFAQFRVTVNVV